MTPRELFPTAVDDVAAVVKGISSNHLDRRTPCSGFDLRQLVNHVVGTTGAMARLGRREALDADDPYGSRQDPSAGNWQSQLVDNLTAVAAAWGEPEAWHGVIDLGGGEMPARMIGDMALAETVLHGWDLARATDQRLVLPEELAVEVLRGIEETAELGRRMGAYGDEVTVAAEATTFERALAAAGRDPRWAAG